MSVCVAVLCGGAIVGATASADEGDVDDVPAQGVLTSQNPQSGDGDSDGTTGSSGVPAEGGSSDSGDVSGSVDTTPSGDASSTTGDFTGAGTDVSSDSDMDVPSTEDSSENGASDNAEQESSKAARALPDTVQGVSPAGTTINLFDYWTRSDYGEGQGDNSYQADYDQGINAERKLKFASPSTRNECLQYGVANTWTGYSGSCRAYGNGLASADGFMPRSGMVENNLSDDGYPSLKSGSDDFGTYGESLGDSTEVNSLSYLYNLQSSDSKAVYPDVKDLLQEGDAGDGDNNGYYYYNSAENFASYNTSGADAGKFTLYDEPGVNKTGTSPFGQFFPFNTGVDVFSNRNCSPQNADACINSRNAKINHYFGLSMTSRFVQTPDGKTSVTGTEKPVTYEFAGDDDVWVFIDGVLVGDLGGNHNAVGLKIDFSTGTITRQKINTDGTKGDVIDTPTLLEKFKEAGKDSTTQWRGSTFADNTYHTLKFFYLERGGDSNMNLRFNLVNVPESGVVKVDQQGNKIPGVSFSMYAADANYEKLHDSPVVSGVTDEQRQIVFKKNDGSVLTLDELKDAADVLTNQDVTHFVLVEENPPAGYRSTGEVHLEYKTSGSGAGYLVSDKDNMWSTGARAAGGVLTTLPKVPLTIEKDELTDRQLESGTLFAVVLKYTGKATSEKDLENVSDWYAMTGDSLTGWHTSKDPSMAGVLEAAKEQPNLFHANASGQYQVTFSDLPGDIDEYYHMLGSNDKAKTKYTIGYYWSSKSSLEDTEVGDIKRLDAEQTKPEHEFTRQYSAQMQVSNIQNQLYVQKVDDEDNPLDNVVFSLYKEEQCSEGDDGQRTCSGEPYDKLTTGTIPTPNFKGAGMFPTSARTPLETGTYYLVETTALEGYVKKDQPVEVTVNQYGVFADAGTKDDGVKVVRGVGYLLKTMSSYGSTPSVDDTLTWIKAKPMTVNCFDEANCEVDDNELDTTTRPARVVDGRIVISENPAGNLRYDFTAVTKTLEYGPRTGYSDILYVADEGVPSLYTQQDLTPRGEKSNDQSMANNEDASRTNLRERRLNGLITGSVMVQVKNYKERGPELPETGGAGAMSMIWGGLLLIGCSLTGLAYARKRR